jgi:peptide/nickel transport system substrate-binding protein
MLKNKTINRMWLWLMAGLLSVLLGSVPAEAQGNILKVATTADPPTLDLASNTAGETAQIMDHVFDSLYAYDREFKPQPQLAESYDLSDDKLTWTFHLRKGILFHDGTKMTAEDVKASILRFKEVSPRGSQFDVVTSIETPDPYTIKLRTSKPVSTMINYVAGQESVLTIMPKHAVMKEGKVKGVGELKLPEDYIGTGPFQLVEWAQGDHTLLKKSDVYKPFTGNLASGFTGDREAFVDGIKFIVTPESSARFAALKTGEVDFADVLGPRTFDIIKADSKLKAEIVSLYYVVAMLFNTTENSIFQDARLRRAVQAALSQEQVMETVTAGRSEFYTLGAGSFWFSSQVFWSDIGNKLGTFNQKNPKKAKQLMQEAGYKDERITIITNRHYDWMYRAALSVLSQLKAVGFNAVLEVYDWPTQLSIMNSHKDYDIGYTGHSPRFDPAGWYHYFGPGWLGYNNSEIQKLMEEDAGTFNLDKRIEIWKEIQRLVQLDVPYIYHGELHILQGRRANVKNYIPWIQMCFWNVNLEK